MRYSDDSKVEATFHGAVDQDGVPVQMCAHHPEEPATGWDLFDTPMCEGCCRGLDARDESAQEWDR